LTGSVSSWLADRWKRALRGSAFERAGRGSADCGGFRASANFAQLHFQLVGHFLDVGNFERLAVKGSNDYIRLLQGIAGPLEHPTVGRWNQAGTFAISEGQAQASAQESQAGFPILDLNARGI
jgi:hypothetical protein